MFNQSLAGGTGLDLETWNPSMPKSSKYGADNRQTGSHRLINLAWIIREPPVSDDFARYKIAEEGDGSV